MNRDDGLVDASDAAQLDDLMSYLVDVLISAEPDLDAPDESATKGRLLATGIMQTYARWLDVERKRDSSAEHGADVMLAVTKVVAMMLGFMIFRDVNRRYYQSAINRLTNSVRNDINSLIAMLEKYNP